jgi:hypothetical protein
MGALSKKCLALDHSILTQKTLSQLEEVLITGAQAAFARPSRPKDPAAKAATGQQSAGDLRYAALLLDSLLKQIGGLVNTFSYKFSYKLSSFIFN